MDKFIPFRFMEDNEIVDLSYKQSRGYLTEVHLADLHFGALNPKTEYDILEEQVFKKIESLPKIDIISIDGDFWDHKVMSNSDTAMYGTIAADRIVSIARNKNATVVFIYGTKSHDADQLKLFYHYLDDPTVDVRIVSTIQFEYIKGARILCIPELYGIDESTYKKFLYYSGFYDGVFMHGTFKGAVYGDNVGNGRLFCIEDFLKCRNAMISGHVHKSGCFNKYFYYTGTPIRYKFGEEEPKGFMIVLRDLDNGYHYTNFEEVKSFRYDTIELDTIINTDPKIVIDYINRLKQDQGIDFIKIKFKIPIDGSNKTIISNYYRNSNDIKVEFFDIEKEAIKKAEEEAKENNKFAFITDEKLSDEEKFCKYCNIMEGYDFITVDKLKEILEESI